MGSVPSSSEQYFPSACPVSLRSFGGEEQTTGIRSRLQRLLVVRNALEKTRAG